MGLFEFKIDDEITDFFAFKDDRTKPEISLEQDEQDKELISRGVLFLKKNYIYITTKNKIKIKGLNIRKKSTSKLTRKLFWDILVPRILSERKVKFSKKFLEEQINKYLSEDITLVVKRYTCNAPESYADKTNLNSQIAQKLGAVIFFLIPVNKKIYDTDKSLVTIGKNKMFVELEDFKRLKLKLTDINMAGIWKELGYFTLPEEAAEKLSRWF
jgi:hypothetical protein